MEKERYERLMRDLHDVLVEAEDAGESGLALLLLQVRATLARMYAGAEWQREGE